jgi:hypothetical protein
MTDLIQPKYNIGQLLIVVSEKDPQKIVQGRVMSAECFYDKGRQGTWFYRIEVPSENGRETDTQQIYSYEVNTGDAKTKILNSEKK